MNQTWQHVAVTYDGSLGSANVKVYVNGVYKASDDETQDVLYENWAWQIGAHGNSAYEWVGDVDEVRLYKETLSADWIEFEYRNMAEADNELTWAAEEEAPDPEVSPLSDLIGNPYMFTGRRFDLETGLYYYRARYYNPQIGRFLQTDPIGYSNGINWYAYCGNNSTNMVDPSGLYTYKFANEYDPYYEYGKLTFLRIDENGGVSKLDDFQNVEQWIKWAQRRLGRDKEWLQSQAAWEMTTTNAGRESPNLNLFFSIQALIYFDLISEEIVKELGNKGVGAEWANKSQFHNNMIQISRHQRQYFSGTKNWHRTHYLAVLSHEFQHAYDYHIAYPGYVGLSFGETEKRAVKEENITRKKLFRTGLKQFSNLYPRPSYFDTRGEWGYTNENGEWVEDADLAWGAYTRGGLPEKTETHDDWEKCGNPDCPICGDNY